MTPHNAAAKEDIAPFVLMPGDPLRAKYIAEKWLDNPRLVNSVRGMLAYTGTWKGFPITVMGSGMGMPSMGIYSWELFDTYGVKAILRICSCGAYADDLHVFDVLAASDCWSSTSYGKQQNQDPSDVKTPSSSLQKILLETAAAHHIPLQERRIHSSDVFYHADNTDADLAKDKGCAAVEMESFALFHNAQVLGREAACLLTVSDSFVYPEESATAQEREKSFDNMITLALESFAVWNADR